MRRSWSAWTIRAILAAARCPRSRSRAAAYARIAALRRWPAATAGWARNEVTVSRPTASRVALSQRGITPSAPVLAGGAVTPGDAARPGEAAPVPAVPGAVGVLPAAGPRRAPGGGGGAWWLPGAVPVCAGALPVAARGGTASTVPGRIRPG